MGLLVGSGGGQGDDEVEGAAGAESQEATSYPRATGATEHANRTGAAEKERVQPGWIARLERFPFRFTVTAHGRKRCKQDGMRAWHLARCNSNVLRLLLPGLRSAQDPAATDRAGTTSVWIRCGYLPTGIRLISFRSRTEMTDTSSDFRLVT